MAMTTGTGSPTGRFHRRWTLACAIGELVGIGVAAAAGVSLAALVGEPRSPAARLLTLGVFGLVGAVEGGVLGGLEWYVLRDRLPRLRLGEWAGVTAAVAVLGWLIGMTPSTFAPAQAPAAAEPALVVVLLLAVGAGAGAGLCFGAAQWSVLRRHARRAGRWIWIHVVAWGLALAAIFLGASLPTAAWPAWAIIVSGAGGGLAGGLLLGGVTGVVARSLSPWVDEGGWSLGGKVCAVTGASSGIGYEIGLGLARLGGRVILLCRRSAAGERARRAILRRQPGADVTVVSCDLADPASIRAAAARLLRDYQRLDVLVHNAGATFSRRTLTGAGVEATLAVDVMGPFLLTALLTERLEASAARVVTLTGIYQRKGRVDLNDLDFTRRPYDWLAANNQAQRARLLFTSELARRLPKLVTAAVHPGAVLSGAQARLPALARALMHTLLRPAFVRPEVGAIPVLRVAADPEFAGPTGRFFDRCTLTADRADAAEAAAFWDACERLTGAAV